MQVNTDKEKRVDKREHDDLIWVLYKNGATAMQAQEFVKRVKELLPPVEESIAILRKRGLSEEGAQDRLKDYSFPRKNNKSYEEHEDPIIELCTNFDLFRFSAVSFYFASELTSEDGRIIFGSLEAEPLSINVETGEIEMYSHDNDAYLLDCAASSSQFLDALFVATELYISRMLDKVDSNDHELNQRYIEQCTLLAGGEEYEDFFTELLEMREFN